MSKQMYVSAASTVILALLSFILLGMRGDVQDMREQVEQLQLSVVAIEASKFTAADGLDVWMAIAELKSQIPSEVPPKWFVDRVDRLEQIVLENQKLLGKR